MADRQHVTDETPQAGPMPHASGGQGNGIEPPDTVTPEAEEPEFDLGKYAYRAPGGGVVKREQLVIPQGRPRDSYFRVDPRPEMQWATSILEYKPEGSLSPDTYILTSDVAEYLGSRAKPVVIRVCICRPDILKLWAVKIPQTERGRPNSYVQSAWDALAILEKQWACLVQNESHTGFDVIPAEAQWSDPKWRDPPIGPYILKCFKGQFVDSLEHEIIQRIQGRL